MTTIQAIKNTSNSDTEISYPIAIPFGVCTAAYSTTTKTVNVSGIPTNITSLEEGTMINVQFTYGAGSTSSNTIYLNVNGLGAKPINVDSDFYQGKFRIYTKGIATFVYYSDTWYQTSLTYGSTIIKTGSKVVAPSSNSVVLFSSSEQTSTFGRTFNRVTDFIGVMNGDGGAQSAHVQGATYSNGNIYAVFDRSVSGATRINYLFVGPKE